MRTKKAVFVALSAALGAAVGASAYADGGRELLLSGPIEQLDQGTSTVTVLGQKFKAATEQLTVGEVVNIYGQIANDGAMTDTLVQGTEKFGTNGDAVFLKGVVTGSDPILGRAQIDGVSIDYTAELGNADFNTPTVGDVVAVAGTQPALKGTLVVSTTGPAAYAVGAPSAGLTGSGHDTAGLTGSGHDTAGLTGSGHNTAGLTGSGHNTAGLTGSGHNTAGLTGSGHDAAGLTGSGHNTAGLTGSGHGTAGLTGSGVRTAGLTGSGK